MNKFIISTYISLNLKSQKEFRKLKRGFSLAELSVAQIVIAIVIIAAFAALAIFWDVLFDLWNFMKFYAGV